MTNENGGRDVIAAAISDRMNVPILDDLRASLPREEYLAVLELSRAIVESTNGSKLPSNLVAFALVAAAAMYAEAIDQFSALVGVGPHGRN